MSGNLGKEILKAVAIAAFSHLLVKTVDYCFERLKEKDKNDDKEKKTS